MKDAEKQDENKPQVNPPKMSAPDLSKAEMEVRELIDQNEKGERMSDSSNKDPNAQEDDSFHMNKKTEEDL